MSRSPETLGERLLLARTKRDLTQLQLQKLSGVKQSDISKLERGTSQATAGIARLADALRVHGLWLEQGIGSEPDWDNPSPSMKGVAQSLSYMQPTVTSLPVGWEELMSMIEAGKMPAAFSLVLKDDALHPDYPKGSIVRFATGLAPEAGRPVLIKDADGDLYVRLYVVGRGSNWQAAATGRHYQSWDALADGLEVLAAFTGFDLPPRT